MGGRNSEPTSYADAHAYPNTDSDANGHSEADRDSSTHAHAYRNTGRITDLDHAWFRLIH